MISILDFPVFVEQATKWILIGQNLAQKLRGQNREVRTEDEFMAEVRICLNIFG